jgi:putative phosphoesterase
VTTIIVLADCHIHPGGGPSWSEAALAAFSGADLFLTLGDMGEASGLEALAALAPVKGVLGEDDQPSRFADGRIRLVEVDGVGIACVFNPVAEGLAISKDPLQLASPAARVAKLGAAADVLLWASTHVPDLGRHDGLLTVNPGSATYPDGGTAASFARLTVDAGEAKAEIVGLG